MTEPKEDTKQGTERDPALEAAWRAASREEPPVELDEAIRAAARREAGAAPRRKLDKHWWYPLAAAATVAVFAIGLLQLTPPEQVAPVATMEKPAAPQPERREAASAPTPKLEEAPAPPAPAPRSEPFPAAAPSAPPAPAPMARREPLATETQQTRGQAATGTAMAARSDSAQAKQAPARSVDDWVKLIRDLRREGKLAEATRELAAFREAYGERADSLLPADLRDLPPPGAK